MANNQYVNKVVFGDQTLIDLSSDTIAANKMLSGTTAHDKSGALISGNIPIQTAIQYGWNNAAHRYIVNVTKGYYDSDLGVGITGLKIPVPTSGVNSFSIQIPNGTTNPDPSNSEDWITVTFTVDSSGNTEVFTPTNEST